MHRVLREALPLQRRMNQVHRAQRVLLDDQPAGKDDREYEALISTIKDLTIKMIEAAGDPPRELVFSIRNMQNTMYMLGFACCHIVAKPDEKQELLAIDDVKNRA